MSLLMKDENGKLVENWVKGKGCRMLKATPANNHDWEDILVDLTVARFRNDAKYFTPAEQRACMLHFLGLDWPFAVKDQVLYAPRLDIKMIANRAELGCLAVSEVEDKII